MRIGIDASRANQERRTGTEWYAFHVINQMIRQADPSDRFILYVKEPLVPDWPTLPAHVQIRVLRWPPQFMWTQFRLAWEMLWHAPEVLFVPAHTIPIISPDRTITTLHDIGFEYAPELYSAQTIGPRWVNTALRLITGNRLRADELSYHRWSARLAIQKAVRVITVSEFSKREISSRFQIDPEKITVVPCGYNSEYTPLPDAAVQSVRAQYNLTNPFFLFIGRIERKKNISVMIDAFEQFSKHTKKFDFVLIGNPGYGYEEISRNIDLSPMREHILRLGWVPSHDLPYLMNAARAFLFVTAYEGFGIPNLEAMACRIPVITSSHGATAEVVGDAAVTVDPRDPEAIARAMECITQDTHLREAVINKGLEQIKRYSWEKAGRAILGIIKTLK